MVDVVVSRCHGSCCCAGCGLEPTIPEFASGNVRGCGCSCDSFCAGDSSADVAVRRGVMVIIAIVNVVALASRGARGGEKRTLKYDMSRKTLSRTWEPGMCPKSPAGENFDY